jgi:hypothetical protein
MTILARSNYICDRSAAHFHFRGSCAFQCRLYSGYQRGLRIRRAITPDCALRLRPVQARLVFANETVNAIRHRPPFTGQSSRSEPALQAGEASMELLFDHGVMYRRRFRIGNGADGQHFGRASQVLP